MQECRECQRVQGVGSAGSAGSARSARECRECQGVGSAGDAGMQKCKMQWDAEVEVLGGAQEWQGEGSECKECKVWRCRDAEMQGLEMRSTGMLKMQMQDARCMKSG
ncbi:hypothetical protein quinque_013317 [Culex quinquefasciatus]